MEPGAIVRLAPNNQGKRPLCAGLACRHPGPPLLHRGEDINTPTVVVRVDNVVSPIVIEVDKAQATVKPFCVNHGCGQREGKPLPTLAAPAVNCLIDDEFTNAVRIDIPQTNSIEVFGFESFRISLAMFQDESQYVKQVGSGIHVVPSST